MTIEDLPSIPKNSVNAPDANRDCRTLRPRRHLIRFGFLLAGIVCMIAPRVASAQSVGGATGAGSSLPQYDWMFFQIMDYTIIAVLVLASIAGVALAINAIITIRERRIIPPESIARLRGLLEARKFKELIAYAAEDQTFVSQALHAALRRAPHGYAAMHEAYETAAGELTADQFRRIEFLHVIGNIGPLIGLLGTVLGMIIAFYELGLGGGTPDPARLALGISIALWHTFGGLAVAIPSLVVFGIYRTRIDRITNRAALLGEELLEACRPESPAGAESEQMATAAG